MAKLTGKAKAKFLKRMAKGRKAAIKSRGGKKSASGSQAYKYPMTDYRNGKKVKIDQLEGRVIELENIIKHFGEMDPSERAKIDVHGGMIEEHSRLNAELKRELESGRNS